MKKRKLPFAVLAVEATTKPGYTVTAFISAKEWLWVKSRGSNGIAHCSFFMDGQVWVNKWNAKLVKIVNPN